MAVAAEKKAEGRPVVPADAGERNRLRAIAREHVAASRLVPPLSMSELREQARRIAAAAGIPDKYHEFMMVMIGNEVWRDTVAGIPFERRVLLLPQCLRLKQKCRAEMDEFGLVCEQCGACVIGELQAVAENLGYVVLVAEGTTVVTNLLKGGKVDAVVGVSCLSVLEQAFPHMAADAVPGLAIPLIRDGCNETAVDLEWVLEAIRLIDTQTGMNGVDLDGMKGEVASWFEPAALRGLLNVDNTVTERIGIDWLTRSGKRWRPLLSAAVCRAMVKQGDDLPASLKRVGMAVECFHKASLVHDDIEDDDARRYDDLTLHRKYGIPVALNVGDYLVGLGYRLIGECGEEPAKIARMLETAARGHCTLCLGQGDELEWTKKPEALSLEGVLEIFRKKTSPAFEVAVQLGAICGGADELLCKSLRHFSEALGVAYQIKDDMEDAAVLTGSEAEGRRVAPGLCLGLAFELADARERDVLLAACSTGWNSDAAHCLGGIVVRGQIQSKSRQLLEHYKNETLRAIAPLQNVGLKSLLHRTVTRILRTT